MTLASDTSKAGINALARAHALMDLVPEMIKLVKQQFSSPPWHLAKVVYDVEAQLDHKESDLEALGLMHNALMIREARQQPQPE